MRRALALLLVALIAASLPAPVRAIPESAPGSVREEDLRVRLRAVRERLQAAETVRAARADAVAKAQAALAAIERQIGERQRTLATLVAEIQAAEARIIELYAERTRLETDLTAQKAGLAALMRSAYALGRLDTLKLLLAQDRMSDSGRLLAYHEQLQRVRAERIARVRTLLRELDAIEQDTREAQADLERSREQESATMALLQEDRKAKAAAVRQLRLALAAADARVVALDSEREELEKLLAQLRELIGDLPTLDADHQPFASRKGRLPRPVAGPVLVAFGQAGPGGRPAAGQRIGAAIGTEIRAVADGRVAFADWLRGYGLLIILDHGDGYMSLYGRCDALMKKEGEQVAAGTVIATVGDSGGAGEPALYFEIRHRGQALDPEAWFGR
jgi:septal ring factor EnvC (AmiA/AmiB activator)